MPLDPLQIRGNGPWGRRNPNKQFPRGTSSSSSDSSVMAAETLLPPFRAKLSWGWEGAAFLSSPGAGSDWEMEARPSLWVPGRFSCTSPSACLLRSQARMWERWESPQRRRCRRGVEQEAGARLCSSLVRARSRSLAVLWGQKSGRRGWRRCWRLGSLPAGQALGFS